MKSIKLAFKPLISLTPGKRVRNRGFFGGVFSHHLQVVHVCKVDLVGNSSPKYRLKKDVETIAGSKGRRSCVRSLETLRFRCKKRWMQKASETAFLLMAYHVHPTNQPTNWGADFCRFKWCKGPAWCNKVPGDCSVCPAGSLKMLSNQVN